MRHTTTTHKRFRSSHLVICALLMLYGLPSAWDAHGLWAANRGKISGSIVDAETKEPLPAVNVVLLGTYMGAATDEQGDYFIANVPVGTYTLRATMIGYNWATVTNVGVSTNMTTVIDLELQQTAIEAEEVTIVAERPLVELDNTSSIMVLGTEELLSQPTTEFTDVLMTLPSINMEGGVMKFRGGGLEEVAFLIDGIRVRNPLNQTPYTRINLSSLQEVEVITGAFDAEYGEARSGVVNIITKEGSDNYELFVDTRILPPGKKHWGVALYDRNTDLFWENAHARHPEWWIENTDQWVDDDGIYGYDPNCEWTPEEAYQNYIDTHQPLTDYTNLLEYQTEISFGGPVPLSNKLHFFLTGKYRQQAPLYGNTYRKKGIFFDGTYKLSYKLNPKTNVIFSGFYGDEQTSWGIGGEPDYFYANDFGLTGRYAYYDLPGLPESQTDGQSVRVSHLLSPNTIIELDASRLQVWRKVDIFPDDPIGWEIGGATYDNLRGVDSLGFPVMDGRYQNPVGYHTLGYWYRYDDTNTEGQLSGFIGSQVNKYVHLKSGFEFTQYYLNHKNVSKMPARMDSALYVPYQGAFYVQSKLEFGGLIMNVGLRYDFYNPSDTLYKDIFDPLNGPKEKTKTFSQLSPRLGLSHPIGDRSVLHLSYGHFFQRASFGSYGEGYEEYEQLGSHTTFRIGDEDLPLILGNRDLKPTKTIAFEIGFERSFANSFVLDLTGYYKDIRNTIRATGIYTERGSYITNSNGNYADVKGFEISIRKVPARTRFGTLWGHINYTTQIGITGRSGDPQAIVWDGSIQYDPSGDEINYNNPRLKAIFYYESPPNLPSLFSLLSGLSLSLEYQAVYPNKYSEDDIFRFEGKAYIRPADQTANLRVRKAISLMRGLIIIHPYLEVHNLFNDKWVYLNTLYRASDEDKEPLVESNFKDIPTHTSGGIPFLEMGVYRNLPRSILFGATFEL